MFLKKKKIIKYLFQNVIGRVLRSSNGFCNRSIDYLLKERGKGAVQPLLSG